MSKRLEELLDDEIKMSEEKKQYFWSACEDAGFDGPYASVEDALEVAQQEAFFYHESEQCTVFVRERGTYDYDALAEKFKDDIQDLILDWCEREGGEYSERFYTNFDFGRIEKALLLSLRRADEYRDWLIGDTTEHKVKYVEDANDD